MKKKHRKIPIIFGLENWHWKSEFCQFWRLLHNWLKYFLMGWLLVLGLKESLLEFVTACIKIEFILIHKDLQANSHKKWSYS